MDEKSNEIGCMDMQMNMRRIVLLGLLWMSCSFSVFAQRSVPEVKWDSRSLFIDGKRVIPVMGEIHYSRVPVDEWKTELEKMKAGGVTMIATYVFWNHIEEIQ